MLTIFIWNNHMAHTRHTYPGHASMNIWDNWPAHYSDNMASTYVSWVPGDQSSASGHRAGSPNGNFLVDLVFEHYAPDHIILIPATPANRQAMARKWAEIRAKNYVEFEFTTNVMGETKTAMVQAPDSGASYRFYRKNCSVIVQRVLKAGGLKRSWTDFFHQKSTIWTPLNVKRLAMTYAGARTVTWGAFLTDLRDRARLTDEAYALLVGFERRTLDHGSSGALPHHFMGLKSTQSVEANRDAIRKL